MRRQEPGERSAGHLPYQPAIDGLRGLAVAAVLAYHAGLPWAKGGFLGVDAFFVLSGYLITSLLLIEWRGTHRVNMPAFWVRRARRLFPALFLMLAGVAGYALLFAEPEELGRLRYDALSTLGYFANWHSIFSGQSYFELFALPSPLRHTWSLAIEEQFYLFWPPFLVLLLRFTRGSLRALTLIAVGLIAASAGLMAWLYEPGIDPSRVYYGTDTRAQSLLVGAVLAMLFISYGPIRAAAARWTLQLAALASAVYVAWLWTTTPDDSSFLYQGGYLLLAIAVAVVIAAVVQQQRGPLGTAFAVEPLRRLGLISYGVYLWHWPLYLVLTPERTGLEDPVLFLVRVAATLAVSIASYRLLETPIRRGGIPLPWRRGAWVVAPAAAGALAVALVIVTWGGASSSPALQETVSARAFSTSGDGATIRLPRILLLGDSVAVSMSSGLSAQQDGMDFIFQNGAYPGCGTLLGDVKFRGSFRPGCDALPTSRGIALDQFQPDVVVLLISPFDGFDHRVDGRIIEANSAAGEGYFFDQMQDAIDLLSSRGAKIALLTTPYYDAPALDSALIDRLNALAKAVAETNQSRVTLIDLNAYVSPEGAYTDTLYGVRVRKSDGVHFTEEGALLVGRWLAPSLLGAAPKTGSRPAAQAAATSVPTIWSAPAQTDDGYTLLAPIGQERLYWVDMKGKVVKVLDTGFAITYAEQLPTGNILALVDMRPKEERLRRDSSGRWRLAEFSSQGDLVWQWGPDEGLIHHDFLRTPRGTTLAIVQFNNDDVAYDKIIEVDRDGSVVWQWNSLDHLDPAKDRGPAEHEGEWLHTNSVSLFADGDLLLSLRNLNRLVRVDYPSGEITWSWGEGILGHQHSAKVLPNGNITVFDNGIFRTQNRCDGPCLSRALEIDPDTGEIVWRFEPLWEFSLGFGDVDRLPNGNTLITFAWNARILEVSPDGRILWQLHSDIEGYVGFFDPPSLPALYRAQRVTELP